MRFFLDTEFYERPGSLQLISIGIVSESGEEFYVENADFIWGDCDSQWLHENVKPHLRGGSWAASYEDIGDMVQSYVRSTTPDNKPPEFWAYFSAHDWVALCWTFGDMSQHPKGWPMFCLDLKQDLYHMGNPPVPPPTGVEHHALEDARWLREAWFHVYRTP